MIPTALAHLVCPGCVAVLRQLAAGESAPCHACGERVECAPSVPTVPAEASVIRARAPRAQSLHTGRAAKWNCDGCAKLHASLTLDAALHAAAVAAGSTAEPPPAESMCDCGRILSVHGILPPYQIPWGTLTGTTLTRYAHALDSAARTLTDLPRERHPLEVMAARAGQAWALPPAHTGAPSSGPTASPGTDVTAARYTREHVAAVEACLERLRQRNATHAGLLVAVFVRGAGRMSRVDTSAQAKAYTLTHQGPADWLYEMGATFAPKAWVESRLGATRVREVRDFARRELASAVAAMDGELSAAGVL